MDGLFHGKPMNKWMIWGAHPYFWKHPYSCVFAGFHAIHHLHLPASKKKGRSMARVAIVQRNHGDLMLGRKDFVYNMLLS